MGRAQLPVVLMIICAVKCLATSYDELDDFADYLQRTSQLSPILKKGVEADDPDDSEEVSDDAWEESGKFEGDLILNDRQRRLIIENVAEGLSRNGIRDGTKRWPNNEVIYFIQVEHFRHDQVQAIHSAIEDLQRASCIKFRRYRKGDPDAVVIQGSRRGCFSQVGYQGGYQVLNLSGRHPTGRGCFRHGTIVHELLHTLGFYHMQSSPVRDDYVDIIWDNIVQAARHNFRKYNSFSVSNFGVSYDYDSVLHYSKRAFSVNGQDTIVPKKKGVTIGQRVGLSEKDTQKLNKMYCDADADEEEENNNQNKKKVIKKKPKQIQGLGYHQGKAVVFKVPTAIPHKLLHQHSDYPFNYFSKKPQILPLSENEDYGAGKEMIYSYNPKVVDEYEEPIYYKKGVQELYSRDEPEESNQYENPNKVAPVMTLNQAKVIKKPYREDSLDEPLHNHDETQEPSLLEAFDRLSKIIKSHVYPSQTPDLSIYKINERLTDQDYRNKIKKDHVDLVIISPNKKPMSQVEKMNAAMHFINKLYDINQSYKRLEDEYLPKIDYGYHKKHRTKEVVPLKEKNIKYVDPSYTSFSDDYEDTPTLSTMRNGRQDEYAKLSSKIVDGERPLGNHGDYHQNKYKGVGLDYAPCISADSQHRPLRYLYLADKRPLDTYIDVKDQEYYR